jgi:uncharacterized protein (TIGR02246 family)
MNSDRVDRDAIAAVLREHVDAVNTTDVELLLKGFTDDVVYIGPGAAPVLGKIAMREYISPIYAQASIQIAMRSESLEIAGDRATEWGSCHGELTLDGGEPISVNLHFMFIYRREPSGDWRISHDISTPGAE